MLSGLLDGLEIRLGSLTAPRLVLDYYASSPALRPFYAGYPWSMSAFQRRAEQVMRLDSAERRVLLQTAVEPTTERAAEKLERIAGGQGFVITTGQQPGLFGGPMYTAYKILTAVRLAQVLEQALAVPVAPLFWLPADDHDWHEVNHVSLLDARNQLHRIELVAESESTASMARRAVGANIDSALDQLESILPHNDFSADLVGLMRRAYQADVSYAQAFKTVIAHTFAPFDLLIVTSNNDALKRFSVPLVVHELEHTTRHAELLRAQTDRLLGAGYHEQVAIAAGAANVMYEDETGRERLIREADGWVLRRTKRSFQHDELVRLAQTQPERFSPNVLLRPVVESFAFPTLAYVGGPAELSYFAQTGCLFAAHEVPMPLVFPRASGELVEAKIRKVLDKFDLSPGDLHRPFHELASKVARDELPESVSTALLQLRRHLTEGYAALVQGTGGIDPTLRGPLESARNASHKQVDDAERKILNHLKKQNDIGLEQLRKASANLFPESAPQERIIGMANYLGRYGPELLNAILENVEVKIEPLTSAVAISGGGSG